MRKLAIGIALASTILATPALARDGSTYAGIEGGLMLVEDLDLDYEDDLISIEDALDVDHKRGFDIDLILGHDFGMIRAEGELGYKRATVDELDVHQTITGINNIDPFDGDGRATALSAMFNVLLDFGDDEGWSGYVGPGIGFARVKYNVDVDDLGIGFRDSDGVLAWQLIAGVRTALSPNMDLGLKYRFFNTRRFQFSDDDAPGPLGPTSRSVDLEGKWRSHSLLASLIFNFGAPPAPPPPPPPPPPMAPPPPATQTCPDGSVILATDMCPAPPPPPPPPPPEPERG